VLARYDVKAILADGLAPLYETFESDKIAKSISAQINDVIARQYKVTGPNIVKITDEELLTFLTMAQKEMPIRLSGPTQGNQSALA
jgi:hypothetical protein